jgi:FixJ family two-component response regulator
VAKTVRDQDEAAGVREVQKRVNLLTPGEAEVLALVVTGRLNEQIAAALGIGEKTVKVHHIRVMEKMQARSVAALVRLADRVGVTAPPS